MHVLHPLAFRCVHLMISMAHAHTHTHTHADATEQVSGHSERVMQNHADTQKNE